MAVRRGRAAEAHGFNLVRWLGRPEALGAIAGRCHHSTARLRMTRLGDGIPVDGQAIALLEGNAEEVAGCSRSESFAVLLSALSGVGGLPCRQDGRHHPQPATGVTQFPIGSQKPAKPRF